MSTDHLDQQPHHEAAQDNAQAPAASVEPVAPQNPQAAGAAAATQHQLLEENVSGSVQKGAHEKAQEYKEGTPGGAAGTHSTGSWSGTVDK
jgi:hypothetical protein